MRDRRNTSLSVSSINSTPPASPPSNKEPFNEKSFLSSPPLSPTLPAPVTKENKPKTSSKRSMTMKGVALLCGLVVFYRFLFGGFLLPMSLPGIERINTSTELVGGDSLPTDPTALVVVDKAGKSQWTIWIPQNQTFPLRSQTYVDMCDHGGLLQSSIQANGRPEGEQPWWSWRGYYTKDRTFLDIADAERIGALPKSDAADQGQVCEKSMTFVLGPEDASFGKSLILLWLSYGLAKAEGRAFFIDDQHWAWGKYSTYFMPPPKPECSQPPVHHIVPCPHNAKHLVVSSATAPFTFGRTFENEFRVPRRHGLASQSRIFNLIRSGYEALFVLTGEDSLYAASRIAKLRDDAGSNHLIGAQIRRGDNHPFEYQYQYSYLPLERYLEGAHSLLMRLGPGSTDTAKTQLLIASDDPDIIGSPDLQPEEAGPFSIHSAQERIQLATKDALDQNSPVKSVRRPGSAYTKYVEENAGWEGGFYSRLFLSLGGATESTVPDSAMSLRQLVGRAYVLDLAILGASDGVVCASSSAACRVLGIALGWDAVKEGRWMNVDGSRQWSWNGQR